MKRRVLGKMEWSCWGRGRDSSGATFGSRPLYCPGLWWCSCVWVVHAALGTHLQLYYSYFVNAETWQIPDKKQFKAGEIYFVSQFQEAIIRHGREGMCWGCEGTGYSVSSFRKQREVSPGALVTLLFPLFIWSKTLANGLVPVKV